MTEYISKTREGARSFSRQALAHQIEQTNFPNAFVSGTQKIGGVTVEELGFGVNFPSVQSALNDVTNLYQTKIDQVLCFDDASGTTPNGTSMTERLTINVTNTVNGATGTVVTVFGIPVVVLIGDNQDAITTKIETELNKYKDQGIAFKAVQKVSGVNNQIDVTFIDTQPHENYFILENGVNVFGATQTPAIPGYGTWTKIGTSDITGTTGGTPVTLAYYKRIS